MNTTRIIGLITLSALLIACGNNAPPAEQSSGDAPAEQPASSSEALTKEVGGVRMTVPAGWSEEPPANQFRLAQFRIGDDGEALVTISGGMGGSVEMNVARWLGQVEPKAGEPELWETEANGLTISSVQVVGTFNSGMPGQPATPSPDSMLLGSVVQGLPSGLLFIKATGPAELLSRERPGWDAMLASLEAAG